MTAALQPSTLDELVDAVRSAPRVIPVGGGTKPRLAAGTDAVPISTTRLTGIVEYDPSEFTFTARSGTPLREIIAALGERGQYLPFDPPFASAGATLGGTVAAGLNGPGRLRFGGLRDFILGVRFVDGEGRLLRLGGKVVKNAAGFDLPKFFVGSLGRFSVFGEITFKVFPRPTASCTLELSAADDATLCRLLSQLAPGRWELDALEASPLENKLLARLAGPADALSSLAADLSRQFPATILTEDAAQAPWRELADFLWAHADGALGKVPLTLERVPAFATWCRGISGARCRVGAAGAAGFFSLPPGSDLAAADRTLRTLGFSGLLLRGSGPLWLGAQTDFPIQLAIKQALDPVNRFPALR
jgi:glycolate oxidase FAD binding subunit